MKSTICLRRGRRENPEELFHLIGSIAHLLKEEKESVLPDLLMQELNLFNLKLTVES